jgi:hypothetical protein
VHLSAIGETAIPTWPTYALWLPKGDGAGGRRVLHAARAISTFRADRGHKIEEARHAAMTSTSHA